MNAIELLRQQFKDAHEGMEMTMDDVTKEVANFHETGKAVPVGAAYAHAVMSEDMTLSMIVLHITPLFEKEDLGFSVLPPDMEHWSEYENWYKKVDVDVTKLREYAKKVYEATDAYLGTLTEGDLDKALEVPGMGQKTLGYLLNNWMLLHFASLNGEVSAAKGFQGKKGYPW